MDAGRRAVRLRRTDHRQRYDVDGQGTVVTVEGALARARAARRIGRVEKARRMLGTALTHAHDDPDVLVELAELSGERGALA
ncbi:tetratricopeptide repeat protein [Nocardia ignorata]|uniref:tetratricopeptide repeat protein n=1 Tax=Nocardia ignorata TaxID=145285 RepID=UPI00082CDA0C|nr:tetratricopeptide repeat protein [Nocardia ignorata]